MVAPLYNECTCLRCWRRDSIASLAPALQFSAIDRFRRAVCCQQCAHAATTSTTTTTTTDKKNVAGCVDEKSNGNQNEKNVVGIGGGGSVPLWWIKAAVAHVGRRRPACNANVVSLNDNNRCDTKEDDGGGGGYYNWSFGRIPTALERIPTVEHGTIACVSSSIVSRGGVTRLNIRLRFLLMLTQRSQRFATKAASAPFNNNNLYSVEWRDESVGCGAQLVLLLADSIAAVTKGQQPLLRVHRSAALCCSSSSPLPEFSAKVVGQPKILHMYGGSGAPSNMRYEHFSANVQIDVLLESQINC
jgi:hypothetical protein